LHRIPGHVCSDRAALGAPRNAQFSGRRRLEIQLRVLRPSTRAIRKACLDRIVTRVPQTFGDGCGCRTGGIGGVAGSTRTACPNQRVLGRTNVVPGQLGRRCTVGIVLHGRQFERVGPGNNRWARGRAQRSNQILRDGAPVLSVKPEVVVAATCYANLESSVGVNRNARAGVWGQSHPSHALLARSEKI